MKRFLFHLLLGAFVMIGLPFLMLLFINGDNAMAGVMILFFVIDPFYSLIVGMRAGENAGSLWYLPFLTAALFIAGVWLLFDMGEKAFFLYAGIYLLIGLIGMLISHIARKRNRRRRRR